MSALHEGYRRTLRMRTAEGDAVTLERGHRHGRVWLSFGATTQTTVALSGTEVADQRTGYEQRLAEHVSGP